MLPRLKNLDVIIIPRAPRTVCKKDENDQNDETDGGSAPTISNIPKELKGKTSATVHSVEYHS